MYIYYEIKRYFQIFANISTERFNPLIRSVLVYHKLTNTNHYFTSHFSDLLHATSDILSQGYQTIYFLISKYNA